MAVSTDEVQRQLRLGEDSRWEFKQVEFRGNRPVEPRQDDLADELAAFANARGGVLVCGATDDGHVQGMSRAQMDALVRVLTAACADSITPPIYAEITRHLLGDGKPLIVVEVPPGDAQHDSPGGSYRRVGESKQRMTSDQRMRLAQQRGQSRFLWFDRQPVPETGFATLSERLWKPLVSAAGATEPQRALTNLRLLAHDTDDALRATVAGILLCTETPEQWFPNAAIMATRYLGSDRASGQFDSQEIVGPLQRQIADAARFAVSNMRVAARKAPGRIDMPQYSVQAVFEALVNAVAHRDYSMSGQRIRLSMFADRLEIDSPGALPNGMTIANMESSQATRNEVIASVFGRLPVGDIPGSENRQFLMERRGDGVTIILRKTRETAGRPPAYTVLDDSHVQLVIPAAPLDGEATRATVTVRAEGQPLPGADVLVLFPNRTWAQSVADDNGEADIDLYTADLPMTVYCAAPGYAASLARDWLPAAGALALELTALPQGGSAIYSDGTGHLPGLRGRLNPQRDALDRTFLYADNLSINDGTQQPVHFVPGEDLRLTDNWGYELVVRIVAIAGRAALVEYRVPNP